MQDKYKDEGLVILGFPSNQFGAQEPGSDEQISEVRVAGLCCNERRLILFCQFCTINHGVTFQLMKKSDVNGSDTNPVYTYLKGQKSQFGLNRIKWNFEVRMVLVGLESTECLGANDGCMSRNSSSTETAKLSVVTYPPLHPTR